MKRFKTTNFHILGLCVLFAGLTFTSCNDSSTSAIGEKEMEISTQEVNDFMASTQSSNNIVIDNFSSGGGSWSACGIATINYHEDASIVGGAREILVRDSASCTLGGRAWITIDNATGTAEWYSVGRAGAYQIFNYGTAIGKWDVGTRLDGRGGPWGPNRDAGSELNLSLTLDDHIRLDMTQAFSSFTTIYIWEGNGNGHAVSVPVTAGTNLIPLSAFTNLTDAGAADIDGISIWGNTDSRNGLGSGHIFTSFSIELAVNDPESIEECKKGGWADFGFRNQGQCIRFVNTGQDSR